MKTKLCLGDSLLTCLTEGKSVYEVAKARSRAWGDINFKTRVLPYSQKQQRATEDVFIFFLSSFLSFFPFLSFFLSFFLSLSLSFSLSLSSFLSFFLSFLLSFFLSFFLPSFLSFFFFKTSSVSERLILCQSQKWTGAGRENTQEAFIVNQGWAVKQLQGGWQCCEWKGTDARDIVWEDLAEYGDWLDMGVRKRKSIVQCLSTPFHKLTSAEFSWLLLSV